MTDIETPMPSSSSGEPALEDFFAEPIVQAIMRADGVPEAELREALADVESRFRAQTACTAA